MDNICKAEKYVRHFYNKYLGRVAIGVGYKSNLEEIYPFVFQNKCKESIGIIAMDAIPDEERKVYIYHLGAFKTGCGDGSVILQELCDQADKFKVLLTVSPIVMPNGEDSLMNTNQLIEWYKKYGFRGDSGLSRNPINDK